jgi:hypothetical protein
MGLAKIGQHMQSISGTSDASKERGTAKYKGTHFAWLTSSYQSADPAPLTSTKKDKVKIVLNSTSDIYSFAITCWEVDTDTDVGTLCSSSGPSAGAERLRALRG